MLKERAHVKTESLSSNGERVEDADMASHPQAAPEGARQHEVWLLGQPALADYLEYVSDMCVDGASANKAALVDEWRTANDYYYDLEEKEPNIADGIEVFDLPSEMQPLADELRADPRFRNSFDVVPATFAMVELDRLIICQKHVAGHFVERLKTQLDPSPSPQALFRFCMPAPKPDPTLRIRRLGSKRFSFTSSSLDLRFHEPVLLKPEQVRGYESYGAIAGVLGLVVGFSSNFLSAVRSDNRLVLHNGYHRANALRALGITHAPCVIETVTRLDELGMVAKKRVNDDPAFYFSSARPPMLRDFFDPKLRKCFQPGKFSVLSR
jgi:hypothetical protein